MLSKNKCVKNIPALLQYPVSDNCKQLMELDNDCLDYMAKEANIQINSSATVGELE